MVAIPSRNPLSLATSIGFSRKTQCTLYIWHTEILWVKSADPPHQNLGQNVSTHMVPKNNHIPVNNLKSQFPCGIFNAVNKNVKRAIAKHSPELHIVVLVDIVKKFSHNLSLYFQAFLRALKVALVQFFEI